MTTTRGPAPTSLPTPLLIIVIAGIVLVILFAIIPSIQQLFSPIPMVTISDVSQTISSCPNGSQNYYTYTWQFTLTNNGNVNANVTIHIVPKTTQYFVSLAPLRSQAFLVLKAVPVRETIVFPLQSMGCTRVDLVILIGTIRAV